ICHRRPRTASWLGRSSMCLSVGNPRRPGSGGERRSARTNARSPSTHRHPSILDTLWLICQELTAAPPVAVRQKLEKIDGKRLILRRKALVQGREARTEPILERLVGRGFGRLPALLKELLEGDLVHA